MAETLTKKQQKALAFRSKQKAKKSGKAIPDDLPEADPDIDGVDGAGAEGEGEGKGSIAASSTEPTTKSSGKRKRDDGPGAEVVKSKQDLSGGAKGKAKSIGKGTEGWDDDEGGGAKKKSKKEIKQRFILFIGNLGFKTTANDVVEHFKEAIGATPQVRLLTEKSTRAGAPPKSRGIAFLEVPTSELMQAALKLHHTTLASRRINVELTAGGGGKSAVRTGKIDERNERVGVQRGKRAEKEREEALKNGTLVEGEGADNVNGYKPAEGRGNGRGRDGKGGKEAVKTRGPEVGQKPMRAWGTAGAKTDSSSATAAAPTVTSTSTSASAASQDHSQVTGVGDGTVKMRGGRRVKVNPSGKPQGNRQPPRPRWEPTGPNAQPVG